MGSPKIQPIRFRFECLAAVLSGAYQFITAHCRSVQTSVQEAYTAVSTAFRGRAHNGAASLKCYNVYRENKSEARVLTSEVQRKPISESNGLRRVPGLFDSSFFFWPRVVCVRSEPAWLGLADTTLAWHGRDNGRRGPQQLSRTAQCGASATEISCGKPRRSSSAYAFGIAAGVSLGQRRDGEEE